MPESTIGLLVLLTITVAAGIVWHALMRKYVAASLGAAMTAALLFQAANRIHLGYFDPFWPLAMAATAALAFAVCLLVGLPWHLRRKRARHTRKTPWTG